MSEIKVRQTKDTFSPFGIAIIHNTDIHKRKIFVSDHGSSRVIASRYKFGGRKLYVFLDITLSIVSCITAKSSYLQINSVTSIFHNTEEIKYPRSLQSTGLMTEFDIPTGPLQQSCISQFLRMHQRYGSQNGLPTG